MKSRDKIHMRVFTLFVFLIVSIDLLGRTFQEQIAQDIRQGRITEIDGLYFQALQAYRPDLLPEPYRSFHFEPGKCGLRLNHEIRMNWYALDEARQHILMPYIGRPDLPNDYISTRGLFRIHYTTAGYDAVSNEDLDDSGVPDYIEEVAQTMDHVYHVEIEEMGFQPPPADLNVDGPEWDVYIKNIIYYGFTNWEESISENPDVWTSYVTMDNDYTHTPTKGVNALHVTAAHEFLHMIQFGYHFREDDVFLMEAAATWMEDAVYDSVNDYINYLSSFFQNDNIRFDRADGLREYGLSIWFHFLEKQTGTVNIVREVWEQIVTYPAMRALDAALINRSSSFADELSLFYGWNYMTGSRADTLLFYPEGDAYPEITPNDLFYFAFDTVMAIKVKPTASRYYQFYQADGSFFTLVPTNVNYLSNDNYGECTLALVRREDGPDYTDLGHDARVRLVSQEAVPWQCVAVVEFQQEEISFLPFDEIKQGVYSSIGGTVWEDHNIDAVKNDDTEQGIPDVTINLTGWGNDNTFQTEDDIIYPSQVTGQDGYYQFDSLFAGYYRVNVVPSTLPADFLSTTGKDYWEGYLSEGEGYHKASFGFRKKSLPATIPNPFVPDIHREMKILFTLSEPDLVHIAIFQASGFKIKEEKIFYESKGIYSYLWDGRSETGRLVPSGVYLYVITADGQLIRRDKFAVIR